MAAGDLVLFVTGVVLVVALGRLFRLRPVTAVIVGLCLELLIGPSALSLLSFLTLNGLEQTLSFMTRAPGEPGQIGSSLLSPLSHLGLIGLAVWAVALQQVALRPADEAAPRPLARSCLGFVAAHRAPLAALALVVALARFALPGFLNSPAVVNPAHFTPTGANLRAQFLDCYRAYGVNLPPGTDTRTASIPDEVSARCNYLVDSYPSRVKGRGLPLPVPVTAGGVTYTVTSLRLAGNVLKIDWRATGGPVDAFGALVYPASGEGRMSDRTAPLEAQYFDASVVDGAGGSVSAGPVEGWTLPRSRPYRLEGETVALVPGRGHYSLRLGCATPLRMPPALKGGGLGPARCDGGPNATITLAVTS